MTIHFNKQNDGDPGKGNDQALADHYRRHSRSPVKGPGARPTVLTAVEYSAVSARKMNPFYFRISFLFLVVAPILFGTLFFGLIATDRYVSHTQLTVRSASGGTTSMLSGLIGAVGGATASTTEAYIVQDYIRSRDILADLQSALDIKALYENPNADYFSRLSPDASNEELYEYFLDHTEVVYDPSTQIVSVNVQAFSPADAQTIATAIVSLCDALVNRIAQKSREDGLHFAKIEVERAEKRVEAARMALNEFRLKHGELDPVSSASAVSAIVAGIEAELAKTQTELTTLRSYLRADSAQVITVKSRLMALKKQLSIERVRLAGPQSKGTFIPLLAEFERLKIEDTFSKEAYTATGAALEIARGEANRKHLYLVAFVKPSLPDEALEPARAKMIFTVVICSLLFYGLFSLLTAAIREHARV